jgi:hypothetical protein
MGPLAVSTLAALILAAAPAPEKKPDARDPTQPVLLVRGIDELNHAVYLVHAVPQTPPAEPTLLAGEIHSPLVLMYTSPISGQMKRLVASGHSAVPGPPMGIDRIHHTRTTIAGVKADNDLLFVALHTASWTVMQPKGRTDGAERSKYELLVFRLKDGEKLHVLEIKDGDFPKGLPHDTSEAGPLEVVCGGVTCYGVVFKFKGKEVEQQRYEKEKK